MKSFEVRMLVERMLDRLNKEDARHESSMISEKENHMVEIRVSRIKPYL